MQVFCQEQPGRDGRFYRSFVAANYAGLWAHYEHVQQRHFYEVGTVYDIHMDMSVSPVKAVCTQTHNTMPCKTQQVCLMSRLPCRLETQQQMSLPDPKLKSYVCSCRWSGSTRLATCTLTWSTSQSTTLPLMVPAWCFCWWSSSDRPCGEPSCQRCATVRGWAAGYAVQSGGVGSHPALRCHCSE